MAFADLINTVDASVLNTLGGVDVLYQAEDLDDVTVKGIFDENYRLLDEGAGGVETFVPSVWIKTADLPGDPASDDVTVTIGATAYRVIRREMDRTGTSVRLFLMRVLS